MLRQRVPRFRPSRPSRRLKATPRHATPHIGAAFAPAAVGQAAARSPPATPRSSEGPLSLLLTGSGGPGLRRALKGLFTSQPAERGPWQSPALGRAGGRRRGLTGEEGPAVRGLAGRRSGTLLTERSAAPRPGRDKSAEGGNAAPSHGPSAPARREGEERPLGRVRGQPRPPPARRRRRRRRSNG